MPIFTRVCPFCNLSSTRTDNDIQERNFTYFDRHDKNSYCLNTVVLTCPTLECKKSEILIFKYEVENNQRDPNFDELIQKWNLEPTGNVKVFPDFVPNQILQDYKEAKLILELSPKASATLSRRCLQSMIRDYWGISGKKNLHQEIEAIRDKMNDEKMYDAIMALKSIGNIGAHPEVDINLIIDVDPEEANELIWLIETLIEDWYIAREERNKRIKKIQEINSQKQLERKSTDQ